MMADYAYNRLTCVGPIDDLERVYTKLLGGTTLLEEWGELDTAAFEERPVEAGSVCLVAYYRTRWGAPEDEALDELTRAFPAVCFENVYTIMWTCTAGRLVVQNGSTFIDEHLAADIPEEDFLRRAVFGARKGIGDPHTPKPWLRISAYLHELGWDERAAGWQEIAADTATNLTV